MKPYLTTIIVLEVFDATYWSHVMDYRDNDFKLAEMFQVGWLVRETDDRYIVTLEQVDNSDVKHTISIPKVNVRSVRKYKYEPEGALVEQDKD